jgi:hypothetical protein
MTAPVNDSPFLASTTKPLIVNGLDVIFSENPGHEINEKKVIKAVNSFTIKMLYY